MFLVLPSPRERNILYDKLIGQRPEAQLSDRALTGLTREWQTGQMSNYDYLMMLNRCVQTKLSLLPFFFWCVFSIFRFTLFFLRFFPLFTFN